MQYKVASTYNRAIDNVPTMQFFTGISGNTHQICYHWLSLAGISKILRCGILINMPYCWSTLCSNLSSSLFAKPSEIHVIRMDHILMSLPVKNRQISRSGTLNYRASTAVTDIWMLKHFLAKLAKLARTVKVAGLLNPLIAWLKMELIEFSYLLSKSNKKRGTNKSVARHTWKTWNPKIASYCILSYLVMHFFLKVYFLHVGKTCVP